MTEPKEPKTSDNGGQTDPPDENVPTPGPVGGEDPDPGGGS